MNINDWREEYASLAYSWRELLNNIGDNTLPLRCWQASLETLQDRFDAPTDKPGVWFLTEGIAEEGSDYLRQICNEGRREVRDKKGRPKVEWIVVDHRLGNHYWDCEVYARAAADMVTGQDWRNMAERAGAKPKSESEQSKQRTPERRTPQSRQPYGRIR